MPGDGAVVVTPASNPAYRQLVLAVIPDDLDTLSNRLAAQVIDRRIGADAELAALVARRPALRGALIDTYASRFRPMLETSIALKSERLAQHLMTRLTVAEAQTFAEFMYSPLGRRIMGAVVDNLDLDGDLGRRRARQAALEEVAAELTESESRELAQIAGLVTRFRQAIQEFRNVPDPNDAIIATQEDREALRRDLDRVVQSYREQS